MKITLCWIQLFVCFCLFCYGLSIWREEKSLFMKGLAIFVWGCIPCLTIIFIQSVFM